MFAKLSTRILSIASLVYLAGCGGGVETETNPSLIDPAAPVSDWTLVWSDEFDGTAIDTTKWNHEVNCDGGGNNERQCYTASSENSFVADGMLNIVAMPAEEGAEKPYTSARMTTKNKGDFKYGRFEMRAKLPFGQGAWPAFWMMPTDSVYGGWPRSGEIDIMEAVNLKAAGEGGLPEAHTHGTLHYGREWPNNSYSGKEYLLPDGQNPADDFHTYAIEWQEGEIRWYVDGYLFATQRKSTVRYNSKGEAVGLSHQGWFSEYYDQGSGELTTHWGNSPYDQEFFMILNFAVGGDWPENVNETGIDPTVFEGGQAFQIDYVRVYECAIDPETGKGCETVRGGYDSTDDALVEGLAPFPTLPSTGAAQTLTIFDGTVNPSWPAWDCCGGSTPALVSEADRGDVMAFTVGATPTVNGFISRAEFITDPAGNAAPFDASPAIESGKVTFDLKIATPANSSDAQWFLKIESNNAATAVDFLLSESLEGAEPVTGEWQTYTYSLQMLADAGLDLSAIDVVMVFPTWGAGEGAEYHMDNVQITAGDTSSPQLVIFEDAENPAWPLWDCCGGSLPTVETDDDAHGAVAEFVIGETPTVMGFISRAEFITDETATPSPFDATPILANGVVQFELKVTAEPTNPDASWIFKIESVDAATAVEIPITDSVEGVAPTLDSWQTYTFNLADLADAGLDVSALDVIMIFPAWGQGEGAVYRVDNAKIYDPNAASGFVGHVLFADAALENWSIWDCCGGSTPTVENDDTEHGATAEFVIGATPTVMGLLADDEVYLDVSNLLSNGVVQFEMKVISAPNDAASVWKFKIESGDAATAVELDLTDSQEGTAPVTGEWQTYTYSVQDLFDAGLDLSQVDVIMVFPAWGTGEGAVYRLDNVMIYDPSSLPAAEGLTLFRDGENEEWPIWDCCGGSTPSVEDGGDRGAVAEFMIGATPTVMGFLANEGISYDATSILQNGVVRFDMNVVSAPNDSSAAWKFKIESGGATTAVELDLNASEEGADPVEGEWQTYTFSLLDLFDAGLDVSEIDVVMVFPAWGSGEGAVYRIDNAEIVEP